MLLLFIFSMFVANMVAQQEVTGTVKSDDGLLLPGVSVVLKGTKKGVSTDFDGNYSIQVPTSNATLVFSYTGMITQEMLVGDKKVIDVILKTSSEQLNQNLHFLFG